MLDITDPKPGIYSPVSFDDYCLIDAINCSKLKHGLTSMKHLKAAIDGEFDDEDSPDRRLGRALHCRLLEPQQFDWRFPVATTCSALIGKDQRQCSYQGNRLVDGLWFCGVHAKDHDEEEDYVTADELKRIEAARNSVMTHKVGNLLHRQGGSEVVMVAEIEGVLLKCRCDKFIPNLLDGVCGIVDLKKVQRGKCNERDCKKAAAAYGYGLQAAMYRMVAEKLTEKRCEFFLVFFEDDSPHDVMVRQQTEADFDFGRNELMRLIGAYKLCQEQDRWPGIADDIEEGILPDWQTSMYQGNL